MKVKEESEKAGLKLNIQKMKIIASGPITSWEIDGETVIAFIFLGTKITAESDCSEALRTAVHGVAESDRTEWRKENNKGVLNKCTLRS